MYRRVAFLIGLTLLFVAPPATGGDLENAFPSFTTNGKKAIPVDFEYARLQLEFDPARGRAVGKCEIEFFAGEEGHPTMDLVPAVKQVRLNGQDLGASALPAVTPPGSNTTVRVLGTPVTAQSRNILSIEYELSSRDVTFSRDGVRMVWAMGDVGADRNFLERYACSNLEFDHFQMIVRLDIAGNIAPHQVFTNGSLQSARPGSWRVEFPAYFTTSSFFLHITHRKFALQTATFSGQEKAIPVIAYSTSAQSAQSGVERSLRVLKELEDTYGPYAHDSLTVYVDNNAGGGMEHVGATITDLGALGHEVTHSWFARGVMPANGNAGWIDEAIASWRDNGYPRYTPSLQRQSSNLAGFSDYNRLTTRDAYSYGMYLMGRFDGLFSQGLRPVLREVFSRTKRSSITTKGFHALLESLTSQDLDAYFQRYVYAGRQNQRHFGFAVPISTLEMPPHTRHPRQLTQQDIERLR